jgi:hypothetical protein
MKTVAVWIFFTLFGVATSRAAVVLAPGETITFHTTGQNVEIGLNFDVTGDPAYLYFVFGHVELRDSLGQVVLESDETLLPKFDWYGFQSGDLRVSFCNSDICSYFGNNYNFPDAQYVLPSGAYTLAIEDVIGGCWSNDGLCAITNLTFQANISPIPEPSTWAMLLLGFAGIGFLGYWRKQNARRDNFTDSTLLPTQRLARSWSRSRLG